MPRAYAQSSRAYVVGPAQDDLELRGGGARRQLHLAEHDDAGGAVERDPVTFVDDDVGDARLARLDDQGAHAHHRGLAPAPSDHRGVAHQSATRRDDALAHQHPSDVVGTRLRAHQHDALATLGGGDRRLAVEVGPAHCGAR